MYAGRARLPKALIVNECCSYDGGLLVSSRFAKNSGAIALSLEKRLKKLNKNRLYQ